MSSNAEITLAQLSDSDHFVVCRALKQLAAVNQPNEEVLNKVFSLLASGVEAVEKNALKTLAAFGNYSLPVYGQLVSQLCKRIEDGKGCE